MSKQSRKRRAKQKKLHSLQQHAAVGLQSLPSSTNFQIPEVNLPVGEILADKKKLSSPLKNDVLIKKIKKVSKFGLIVIVIALGLFAFIKYLTRPLPGQEVADLGNVHIASAETPHETYNSKPPTSGSHLDPKADWGIHDTQIVDELQLHNLEDGGVLVQYDCKDQDCSELIGQLQLVVKKYRDKVILAPYKGLDQRIALTAWNRIDTFNDFDEQRITTFINRFRGIDHHKK